MNRLLAMSFFATGSFYTLVGNILGVDRTTAMRSTEKVTNKFTQRFNTFVKFPSTSEEIVKAKEEFYSIAQFPGVVAAIDCTHIRIRRPYTANAETYRNRKGLKADKKLHLVVIDKI